MTALFRAERGRAGQARNRAILQNRSGSLLRRNGILMRLFRARRGITVTPGITGITVMLHSIALRIEGRRYSELNALSPTPVEATEVRAPDGSGVRYGPDGKFIGLLEPNR